MSGALGGRRLWLGIALMIAGALLIGVYVITPTYWHAMFGLR